MADYLDFGAQSLTDLLSPRLRDRLNKAATVITYDDGETIHLRGDAKPGLSIVRGGAVRFSNPGVDGSMITTSVMGPGHCFGEATLFAQLPRTQDATAVGETTIEQISKLKFDQVFDDEPKLARLMLEATTQRLYSVLEFMDDLRRLPLNVRAAKLIASMGVSSKDAGIVSCNQADLAFMLGVSRVSIGKALSTLQEADVVTIGYGKVNIPDAVRLDQWIAVRSPLAPLKAQ